ncbi:MAG TPA: sulfate adenylyltransferase [Nitrososphaeraceae archaeon]|nr:sulfate adenylyltransferase [Nitrososphaeraceae archaeon]
MTGNLILPHGGKLINRYIQKKSDDLSTFEVSSDIRNDAENIATGVFSPLVGFVGQEDFLNVLKEGRLSNGVPWTIPIVLDTEKQIANRMKDLGDVILYSDGQKFGILHVHEIYEYNKQDMANAVYGTTDTNHPGVNRLFNMKEFLVGGAVEVFQMNEYDEIQKFRMHPSETRSEITKRGWKSIVGFQTRNVPHVAHEMLQKAALNIYDGLFLNPLIGKKKIGDFTDDLIISAYESLIDNYFPKNRVLFSTIHTSMRYAGPREAIHHAIMRKNFGCTHFIVGRDHAGVGNYYPPFAAQEIFQKYPDLGITPVIFPSFYFCKKCMSFANEKTCPHGMESKEELSGTMMRKMVNSGKIPEKHLMRPEIAELILKSEKPFVVE